MMLNIDNFKNINYVYGHSAGDYVLKTIVKRLQEVFGKKSVYRFSVITSYSIHYTKLYEFKALNPII